MKIFVDENIPLMTVRELRTLGHDVLDIRRTPDEGMDDDPIWEKAQGEGRLIITTDKGFARFRGVAHHGILIVRLRRPNRRRIHERVMRAMAQFEGGEWENLMVVMRDVAQSKYQTGKS